MPDIFSGDPLHRALTDELIKASKALIAVQSDLSDALAFEEDLASHCAMIEEENLRLRDALAMLGGSNDTE